MQLFFTITEFLKSLTHVFFSQNNLESFFNRWLAAVCNVFNVPLNSLFAVIHCTTRSRFVHLKGLRNTTALHVHHAFLLHDCDMTLPNFTRVLYGISIKTQHKLKFYFYKFKYGSFRVISPIFDKLSDY